MRPPIPFPDGTIIREEISNFVGKEFSLDYVLNVRVVWRTLAKNVLFIPFLHIMGGIWVVLACLSPVMAFSLFGTAIFSPPLLQTYIIFPLQKFLVGVVFFVLISPLLAYMEVLQFKRQCLVTLTETGISSKPRVKIRRRHLSIPWKRVRGIKEWNGDVFIHSFFLPIAVPREAFRSDEERQLLIDTAHYFRRKAQETNWDTKRKR